MPSDAIEAPGRVVESFRGDRHICEVEVGGAVVRVLAHRCGRLVLNRIKVLVGDSVVVEVNGYDPSRGRIVQRR